MSRRVYLLGVAVTLVAGAFLLTEAAFDLRPRVSQANAERIRKGMTLREVEVLLGNPALYDNKTDAWLWTGRTGAIIAFMGSDPVSSKRVVLGASWCPKAGPFARLRAWLGW